MYSARCYVSTAVLHDFIYAPGGIRRPCPPLLRREVQRGEEPVVPHPSHAQTSQRRLRCSLQWYLLPLNQYSTKESQQFPNWGETFLSPMFASQPGLGLMPISSSLSISRGPERYVCSEGSVITGKIYVCGGFSGREVLPSVEVFCPERNSWLMVTDMLSPRSGVSLVGTEKGLLALGGFDGSSRLQTTERYSPDTQLWSPGPPMLSPRSNFAVALLGKKVLAIGGFNGNYSLNTMNHNKNIFYSLPLPSAFQH